MVLPSVLVPGRGAAGLIFRHAGFEEMPLTSVGLPLAALNDQVQPTLAEALGYVRFLFQTSWLIALNLLTARAPRSFRAFEPGASSAFLISGLSASYIL